MTVPATPPVNSITSRLGENAFLVPCEWGTKKPIVTYTERPFEGSKSEAYLAIFNAQPVNIAVYLGKASDGLCAIDFDADEDLAAFLTINPKLVNTTRSRGSRGGMVWLRIQGDYPESCNPEHKLTRRYRPTTPTSYSDGPGWPCSATTCRSGSSFWTVCPTAAKGHWSASFRRLSAS